MTHEGSEAQYDGNIEELEALLQLECKENSQFLIQMDPSPYLHKKRKIGAQFM
jgi:hypothetical protein